jgi:hypothetical protein
MKDLTDEQLNIAICEWRRWKIHEDGYGFAPNMPAFCMLLPSHITGIEALGNMHEAEKRLTREQLMRYTDTLCDECGSDRDPDIAMLICLTARQRAIALLRVVKPEVFL